MLKSLSFLSLATLLSAHGGHTEHLHTMGNLHAVDVITATTALIVTYFIYKKSVANR